MELKICGQFGPFEEGFQYVIIPETVNEADVMYDAYELANSARRDALARSLAGTLRYARLRLALKEAGAPQRFDGVVVPPAESMLLVHNIKTISDLARVSIHAGFTKDDGLLHQMNRQIEQTFSTSDRIEMFYLNE